MKKNISILIAENVADLADFLAKYLTQQGFNVCIASDGVIAKKKLLLHPFDFLITDVMMPEVDGLQLLTWLSQQKITTNIIVSSGIEFKLLSLPNEKNIIMRLPKPYSKESLFALLTTLNKTQKN